MSVELPGFQNTAQGQAGTVPEEMGIEIGGTQGVNCTGDCQVQRLNWSMGMTVEVHTRAWIGLQSCVSARRHAGRVSVPEGWNCAAGRRRSPPGRPGFAASWPCSPVGSSCGRPARWRWTSGLQRPRWRRQRRAPSRPAPSWPRPPRPRPSSHLWEVRVVQFGGDEGPGT